MNLGFEIGLDANAVQRTEDRDIYRFPRPRHIIAASDRGADRELRGVRRIKYDVAGAVTMILAVIPPIALPTNCLIEF